MEKNFLTQLKDLQNVIKESMLDVPTEAGAAGNSEKSDTDALEKQLVNKTSF